MVPMAGSRLGFPSRALQTDVAALLLAAAPGSFAASATPTCTRNRLADDDRRRNFVDAEGKVLADSDLVRLGSGKSLARVARKCGINANGLSNRNAI